MKKRTREEYIQSVTKPTPEKYCQFCGKKLERKQYKNSREDLTSFSMRKYCDTTCMRKAFVKKGHNQQRWRAAHASAQKIVFLIENRPKVCEICGATQNVDIHHKDGNHQNNTSENLMLVCRRCHMKLHRPASVCVICGKEGRTHRGMCDKHYIRWRKYGDPNHKPWSTYRRCVTESEN